MVETEVVGRAEPICTTALYVHYLRVLPHCRPPVIQSGGVCPQYKLDILQEEEEEQESLQARVYSMYSCTCLTQWLHTNLSFKRAASLHHAHRWTLLLLSTSIVYLSASPIHPRLRVISSHRALPSRIPISGPTNLSWLGSGEANWGWRRALRKFHPVWGGTRQPCLHFFVGSFGDASTSRSFSSRPPVCPSILLPLSRTSIRIRFLLTLCALVAKQHEIPLRSSQLCATLDIYYLSWPFPGLLRPPDRPPPPHAYAATRCSTR